MSVLIKGAKPPSGCRWCYFNDDSKCVLIVGCDYDDTNGAKRRKDCPLIELPNHGDLIDRDDIENAALLIWCHNSNGDDAMEQTIEHIRHNIAAVIPAERSEDAAN